MIDSEDTTAILSDVEGRFLVAACATRGTMMVEGTRSLGFDLTETVGLAYPETKGAGLDGTAVDPEHVEGMDGMQDHDLGADLDVGDDGQCNHSHHDILSFERARESVEREGWMVGLGVWVVVCVRACVCVRCVQCASMGEMRLALFCTQHPPQRSSVLPHGVFSAVR